MINTREKIDNAVRVSKELASIMEDISNDVIVANEQAMTIHLACKHEHTEKRECQKLVPLVREYNEETGTFCKDCDKKVYKLELRIIGKSYWLTIEELSFIKTAVSSALSTIKTPFDYLKGYL